MASRKRGRPRTHDPDEALDAAMALFWSRGFAATTLDALSEATGMKRPSLYAAFGDKHALFGRALSRFQADMSREMVGTLERPDLDDALEALFLRVVDVYAPSGGAARGCLVFTVAAVEAAEDALTREAVRTAIEQLDEALRSRFDAAVAKSALPAEADTPILAQMACGLVHTLALRARAGVGRRNLRRLAREAARHLLTAARAG